VLCLPRSIACFLLLSSASACSARHVPPASPLQHQQSAVHSSRGAAASSLQLTEPVLERAAYVRAVLHSNPSLEAARQASRAALARVGQAGALEDPMLDLAIAPLSIGSSRAPLGYEVAVSQRLPWFGKRSLRAAVAQAEAAAAQSDFKATRRDLALAALILYDAYFVAVRSIEINSEHIELVEDLRAAASSRLETGRGSAQDALAAEAELAHMEHDAAVLASERDVTLAQMNELLHRSPEQALPPPPKELPLPLELGSLDARHLDSRAVAAQPEIEAARQRARAEQARGELAQREYYPELSVSASYNSMWDMPEHRWMLGVGVNLPVQTGRRKSAIDEAQAARLQFESEVAHLEDRSRTQVFVGLKQLQESAHILRLFEQRLLPIAHERIQAARAGFTASQNPFGAVIEAQQSLRQLELEYQVARADCDRRHAELERALGRIPGLGETEELEQ
jgi:cobalt-zinc-cadmium efflux system outer membrane protein